MLFILNLANLSFFSISDLRPMCDFKKLVC